MAEESDTPAALQAGLREAQAALAAFARGPARDSAETLSDAFAAAGARIATSLSGAARNGESAFRTLAKTALEQIAKIALDQILPTPGRPNSSSGVGQPERGAAPSLPGMIVNFHLGAGADAESVRRNQAQIAAQVARAAAYGRRNL